MITHEGIDRNFQFLVLEVRKQLETTAQLLEAPSESLLRSVLSRDNYTDTLKGLIEKRCVAYFRHTPTIDKFSANLVS
ncbi:MAG: PhoU family transcriptional regulator, partial [Phycisphaerae bacterium]